MRRGLVLFLMVTVIVISACSGDAKSQDPTLDPNSPEGRGAAIFRANCATCHDVKGDRVIIGPTLKGIASRAGEQIEGLVAEDYLRESILSPNAYVVEGFTEGAMPQNFGRDLTSEEINDLITYLLMLN